MHRSIDRDLPARKSKPRKDAALPRLSETIARLAQGRALHARQRTLEDGGRLGELSSFGSNPGGLRAYAYLPGERLEHPALVVVLHGCTQTAAGYDVGSGWSEMADRHGFLLLYPEQQPQNNPNTCFNWFSPEDNRRGHGEALSIRQMIAAMVERHDVDPGRIFVTGLSAGGAMASVMLATYPELFAGGAIIAGLPYGCAASVADAFAAMRGQGLPGGAALSASVSEASAHAGPWPTISVWHGTADATVNPANARAIVEQWRPLHRVAAEPSRVDTVEGHPRRVWRDAAGRDVIEAFSIAGMGHGTPLDTRGPNGCGKPAPYMLDVGISSTAHLCSVWGLAGPGQPEVRPARASPAPTTQEASGGAGGVAAVIEDALRSAGLMR